MASIYPPPGESARVFQPLRAGKFFLAEQRADKAGFRDDAFSASDCSLMKYQAILSNGQAFLLGRKRVRIISEEAVFIREGMLLNKQGILSHKKGVWFNRQGIWINSKGILFIQIEVLLNRQEIFSIRQEAVFIQQGMLLNSKAPLFGGKLAGQADFSAQPDFFV